MDSKPAMAYFLVTVLMLSISLVSSESCPTDFTAISSRCYYVSVSDVGGSSAETECNELYSGATLAMFQTDGEKRNVAESLSLTDGTRYVIGPYPACDTGCYTIRPMANLITPLIGLISCEELLQYICEAPIMYNVPDDVTISTITSDSTSITVQWAYSSPSTPYTGLRITATPSTDAQQTTVHVDTTETSATLSDLYSGTEYNVTVHAVNEDQLSSGVTTETFTYPGIVPCLLATNDDKDVTISWSSAAGQVDGYRVWAYVTDKTQEDEETSDPSTLSHTFRGKDKKTYAIDIYSYVWIGGTQYWSSPIEADFYLDKNEAGSVNEGSYPCTAGTPAPIVTTTSPPSSTFCPVVDIYTTTLPTTTVVPSTQETTDATTTSQTTTPPTTTSLTTADPTTTSQTTTYQTTTVQTTTHPTTTSQTTTVPTTTSQTTTDQTTTIQTTTPPTTTSQTTDITTTVQTTIPTTTFHTTTTTTPTTTSQTTNDHTTTSQTTTYPTTTDQTTTVTTTTTQTTTDQTTTSQTTIPTTTSQTTPDVTTTVHTTTSPTTISQTTTDYTTTAQTTTHPTTASQTTTVPTTTSQTTTDLTTTIQTTAPPTTSQTIITTTVQTTIPITTFHTTTTTTPTTTSQTTNDHTTTSQTTTYPTTTAQIFTVPTTTSQTNTDQTTTSQTMIPTTSQTTTDYTTTSLTTTNPTTSQATNVPSTTSQTTTDQTTTIRTTTPPTTIFQTNPDVTTIVQTTISPTTSFHTTTSPTTTSQVIINPTITSKTTTDSTTNSQTTIDPTSASQTTTDHTITSQTTFVPTTTSQTTTDLSTTSQTTTDHATTSQTTNLSTTSKTTTDPTTTSPATAHSTTKTKTTTDSSSTAGPKIGPSTLQTNSGPSSSVSLETDIAETSIVETHIADNSETTEAQTEISPTNPGFICHSEEGVLNSEDYLTLTSSEKATITEDAISDMINYINETNDSDAVFSYMESVWPTLFGPNCQSIEPIRSMPTPIMIEYFGATLMENLLDVTNNTLDIAFYDIGMVKEFRMMVNLAVNESDVHLTFGETKDTYVEIPTSTLRNGDCCKGMLFILYKEPPLDEDQNHCTDSDQCDGSNIMIADFLSLEIFPPNPEPFTAPVVFHFTHNQQVTAPNETTCVWLEERTTNYGNHIWNSGGCVTINDTETRTRCECNHLTSFSVLMKVTEYDIPTSHGKVLSVLTFIGCGVSIVCAVLIVILFLCFKLMKEERVLHSMLLVAIAGGQLAFLTGIDRTENKIACKVVAIVIQYFMTAGFSWMLIESIYLYRHVVHVFSSRVNIIYYVIAGWGVPVVLVGISLGVSYDRIPSENFCWLSIDGGAIYAFIGPALAVIIINTVLLSIVLREIRRIIDRDITKIDVSKAKTTAKTLFVFMPVMGAPWVFGVLAINEDTVIFDYLFTTLNSFQGLMIFLIHTIGNKEFRSKICRGRTQVEPYSTNRGRTNPSSYGVTTITVLPMKKENNDDIDHI